jgi:tetratricopeptide (TPR) repeat protein
MHPVSLFRLFRGIPRRVTGLMAATLLLPLLAHAEVSAEVQACLTSVSRLYDELEFEQALEQIVSARRQTRGTEDDIALALYEGVILADLGKLAESRETLKAALLLNPEAKLPVQVSPKVVRLFENLRQEVTQELATALAQREAEQPRLGARPPPLEVEPAQLQVPEPPDPALVASPAAAASGHVGPSAHVLIPAIAGGVLLAAGGVSWGLALGEQSRLRGGDSSLASYEDVQQSMSRGRSFQTVGAGLVGLGVLGLGIAAGLHAPGVPKSSVAVGLGTNGTSAFVYGRWP